MQEITIPHFDLSREEQDELIGYLKDTKVKLENYYKPLYLRIVEAKYAKNAKNPPKALLPTQLFGGKDKVKNKPDIHLPLLKDIANSNIAEFIQSIFTNDFLSIQSVDPQYRYMEQDVTDGFNAVREETRCDEKEIQIIDDACWQGTCPIVIENTGRYNAVHEIIDTYQLDVPDEARQLAGNILSYAGEISPEISYMLQAIIQAKSIIYKEEETEYEGHTFRYAVAHTDSGVEILKEVEDEEMGIPALTLLKDSLEQMFTDPVSGKKMLDTNKSKILNQEIKTIESWVQGLPKPKILSILQTYVVPACVKDDPDTITWLYWDYKRTQDVVDDPSFMNLDQLYQGSKGQLIGKSYVNMNKDLNAQPLNTTSSYDSKEPVVEFKQAYFDQFRFKCNPDKILRNFMVSTVDDTVLIECRPNVSYSQVSGNKMSKNPLILVTYYKNSNENIGTSPILDSLDLSKASNILINYALDTMSRNGNKYAYFSNVVDIKTMNGGTATLVEINGYQAKKFGITNVEQAFQAIQGNYNDAIQAINSISMFKDQIQQLSNSSQPYFESKNGQTATEVATIANQASGMISSRIKHISKSLEDMYQRMLEDCINRGVKIERVPTSDESGQAGFKVFDFGDLKGKKFIVRLASVSPQLNKAVQVNVMKELLTLALSAQMPEIMSRINISEMTEEIMKLSGLDNPKLTRDDDEAKLWMEQNDTKTQIFNAIQSGQYQLVAKQPAISSGQAPNTATAKGQSQQANSPEQRPMGLSAA